MQANGHPPDSETIVRDDLILKGLRDAVRDTFREHKLLGLPIAVWKDGKAVWLQPEEIELDEPTPTQQP